MLPFLSADASKDEGGDDDSGIEKGVVSREGCPRELELILIGRRCRSLKFEKREQGGDSAHQQPRSPGQLARAALLAESRTFSAVRRMPRETTTRAAVFAGSAAIFAGMPLKRQYRASDACEACECSPRTRLGYPAVRDCVCISVCNSVYDSVRPSNTPASVYVRKKHAKNKLAKGQD